MNFNRIVPLHNQSDKKQTYNYTANVQLRKIFGSASENESLQGDSKPQAFLENGIIQSSVIHLLVIFFGMASWLGINGIYVQLPLLVNVLPERWSLAGYLVVVVQVANVAPLSYTLIRHCLNFNEASLIRALLVVECVGMGLLAIFYDKTTTVDGINHSAALLILSFFIAVVSCMSSILFMPYLNNFKKVYLTSYFIGEGLSGVIPSVLALIQGVGGTECVNSISGTQLYLSFPRFTTCVYFIYLVVLLVLSLIAFFVLENASFVSFVKSSEDPVVQVDSKEDNCTSNFFVNKKLLCIQLGLFCLLGNGLLPGLQPYSCMSYSHLTYHLSTSLSQIANPTACLFTLCYIPSGRIINGITIATLSVNCYVIYLTFVSPNVPLRNTGLGQVLTILSWTLLMGFISYLKLAITSVLRKDLVTLFDIGVIMQIGSACGAVLSFALINCTELLEVYIPCSG